MEEIFHITDAEQWDAARDAGSYTGSTRDQSLAEVGFIHCSFAHQVQGIHDLLYRNIATPHVVLTIDPARVHAPIKIENEFPHIYGPLNADAVIAVRPLDG